MVSIFPFNLLPPPYDADSSVPTEWEESDPRYISNSAEVGTWQT